MATTNVNSAQQLVLNRPDLLVTAGYIGDAWIVGDRTFPVTNPATGALLAEVADLGASNAEAAVAAAVAAQLDWANKTAKERASVLRNWFDLILQHQDDLAVILTSEQGKPLAEALGEIGYAASFIEWFAEEGRRAYGDVIPAHRVDHRLLVLKQPVGVVAAITPWNFPAAMITRKAGPALAAGCAMVLKPSELTPLTALALAKLSQEAGMPPGVFNVVPGLDAAAIGEVLTSSKSVRKISFTGSTAVGKILIRQSADTVKKVTMELGGNAPFIVFDDADLDEAVAGAIACKFRNAGQTCITANRFFIQSRIFDAFVDRFTEAVGKLRVGNGMEEGTDIGPLIDERAISKVSEHVTDAIAQGATLVCGGQSSGHFFSPTILLNTNGSMKVMGEETFGPVAAISMFSDEEQVIAIANQTDAGLAAYFYTKDFSRVWRVAEALEYGMIGINSGLLSTELAPFGGIKQSGLGVEGSKYGLSEYIETKYLCAKI